MSIVYCLFIILILIIVIQNVMVIYKILLFSSIFSDISLSYIKRLSKKYEFYIKIIISMLLYEILRKVH